MTDPGREALIKKWRQLAMESWHHTVMTAYQTCVADLEAALQGSASPPTQEWRPISTALKDGTPILVSWPVSVRTEDDPGAVVVSWNGRAWATGYGLDWHDDEQPPSLWMPLPAALQGSASSQTDGWVEQRLRSEWWLGHGCTFAALYGDDGEMQCNALTCHKDFKRDSLEHLRKHVDARRLALAASALSPRTTDAPTEEK